MKVVVIDEGSPGHTAQSQGIVELLQRHGLSIEIISLTVHNRLPGLLRPIFRFLVSVSPTALNYLWFWLCYGPLDKVHGDLIVSSGGKSAMASRILKQRWNARSIFVGVPNPFSDRWFDLIISPVHGDFLVPSIVTGVIPNRVTADSVLQAAKKYWPHGSPDGKLWAILIGGNSRSHQYSVEDWRGIVEGINTIGRQGVRWLITTSRRTPPYVETLLADYLDDTVVEKCVLYNQHPEKVVQPYLAIAERIVVTQDSLTMASEALCSGKPVTLLTPSVLLVEQDSFFAKTLENFGDLDGVKRLPAIELSQSLASSDCQSPKVASLDHIIPELIRFIENR